MEFLAVDTYSHVYVAYGIRSAFGQLAIRAKQKDMETLTQEFPREGSL